MIRESDLNRKYFSAHFNIFWLFSFLFTYKFMCIFFSSFRFFFVFFTETISISDQISKGIIFAPLKLTLFIEEVKMYLCFNKRWRLVPSVSTKKRSKHKIRKKSIIVIVSLRVVCKLPFMSPPKQFSAENECASFLRNHTIISQLISFNVCVCALFF